MYVLRLVNIQDHTTWMSRFETFQEVLNLYGDSGYQQRMWQIEVWCLPESIYEYTGRSNIVVTMQSGRWRITSHGELHFGSIGYWPLFPEDRRG